MYACAHNHHGYKQFAHPTPFPTLSPLSRGTDQEMLTPLFFFLFSSSVSRHRILSCRPRRTLPLRRATSGGASAPEPPLTTRSQPEPIRTVPKTTVFFPSNFRVEPSLPGKEWLNTKKSKEIYFFYTFCIGTGVMRVARDGSRVKAPPLAVRPVKGGGSKGDTRMPHRSLLYRAQDSS